MFRPAALKVRVTLACRTAGGIKVQNRLDSASWASAETLVAYKEKIKKCTSNIKFTMLAMIGSGFGLRRFQDGTHACQFRVILLKAIW